jgi:very-long-chain enoyl-CoA reductase
VYFQKAIYGKTYDFNLNQKLGILMNILHYMKREYETIYVHRFSAETMPWTNIIKNSTHYWVINGLLGMYFFLRPDYTAPAWLSAEGSYVIFALFCFCELMNLMCHGVLRDLRKPGTTTRGIPHGFGFD